MGTAVVGLMILAVLTIITINWYVIKNMKGVPAMQHSRRRMTSLPSDAGNFAGMELGGADLRALNLRNKGPLLLAEANFDSWTIWPTWPWRMPAGFNPKAILAEGKNPGLGLRELHKKGITGRDVAIGIIDQDLLVEHVEYTDRLRMYEKIDAFGNPQIHGAVASIAAGRTVGVAPEADIYYFVIRMEHNKCKNIAAAIGRILDVNSTLPGDKRIKVVSISCSWRPGEPGYGEVDAMARKAKSEGIFVVSTVVDQYYDFSFHGLGRIPGRDPDDISSYIPGAWWSKEFEKWYPAGKESTRLLVPMDSRTVSSPSGKEEYAFYRIGGWSWCVPYIAGLYALALQVDKDLTVDEFKEAAIATAQYTNVPLNGRRVKLGPIVNPGRLIKRLALPEKTGP